MHPLESNARIHAPVNLTSPLGEKILPLHCPFDLIISKSDCNLNGFKFRYINFNRINFM